jgi:16S rRNA (cytosine967-C5)-methyltransferase
MEDTGDILACDIDRNRLMELERRAKRAGISIVRTLLLDENLPIHKQLPKASADLVLVDAPCTGSGTWRRAPDSRWRYSAEDLQDFAATQRRLLDQAAQLARPGGAVVYATCSIYSVENQDIVDKIRKKHQYIVDAPLSGVAATVDKKNLESSTSCLQLTPHLHKTDGMFMAAFCHKDQ